MEISNKRYELLNFSPGVLLFGVGAGHLYQDTYHISRVRAGGLAGEVMDEA
jgi:hypothetical protein